MGLDGSAAMLHATSLSHVKSFTARRRNYLVPPRSRIPIFTCLYAWKFAGLSASCAKITTLNGWSNDQNSERLMERGHKVGALSQMKPRSGENKESRPAVAAVGDRPGLHQLAGDLKADGKRKNNLKLEHYHRWIWGGWWKRSRPAVAAVGDRRISSRQI
jgi:hypothetical protein